MWYLYISLQEPLQQPEQPQPPQQTGSSPWPDPYELGTKPFLSPVQSPLQVLLIPWPDPYELGAKLPVQSPLIAQVPLLGAQAGNTLPLSQLPKPVSTSPQSKPPLQAAGLPLEAAGLPQPVSTSPHSKPPFQAVELPQSSQQLPAVAPTPTFEDPETGPQHDYAAKATKFLARVQQVLRIKDIQVELTQGNYKEKLHKLLCWEEKAHIEILGEK